MEYRKSDNTLFPRPVSDLLEMLSSVGFFEESMLIGSWVMPLYREFFDVPYALRTMDIDFAVELLKGGRSRTADLEKLVMSCGFTPFFTQSGVQKFSRDAFTIEFIVHRRGGNEEDSVLVPNWNITAVALPFVNIMTSFPFLAEFPGYKVRAPIPEAFFLHKLIASARRREDGKRAKDLDQCSVIASKLDKKRLEEVRQSVKLGSRTRDAIRTSCEAINFPPQLLCL